MSRQPVDRVMHFECNCKICLDQRGMPAKITVKNATIEEVNGEYHRQEKTDGRIVYAKNGVWDREYHCFWICSDGRADDMIRNWEIRAVPLSNPDNARDNDDDDDNDDNERNSTQDYEDSQLLYEQECEVEGSRMPPKTGWENDDDSTTGTVVGGLELIYTCPDNVMRNINKERNIVPLLDDLFFHSRVRTLEGCKAKLELIPHSTDRDKIYASMFRFLFSNPCDLETAHQRVEQDLQVAFVKERYTALELVVWKATCRMYIPNIVDTYELLTWLESGWKKLKTDMRHSRDINVIMMLVIAFEQK